MAVAGAQKKRARKKRRLAEPPQCVGAEKEMAVRCCSADGVKKVDMGKYNKKCRTGTYKEAQTICNAVGGEPTPPIEKVKGNRRWFCTRKGVGLRGQKSLDSCAKAVFNDPECVSKKFDYNGKYKGQHQCKCVTKVPCKGKKRARHRTTFQFKLTTGVDIKNTDSIWRCARKGLGNKRGFGHKDSAACASAVLEDERCTTGQFDYNQKYNGQCKCVVADSCVKVKGLRNYNTYQITPWEKREPTITTTTPGTTTTTTTICVPGTIDDSDLCNHKTCVDDGSAWMVAHEDCAEDAGVQCPAGETYAEVEGECCRQCVFEHCPEEGQVGTDECPVGCVHVEDEDECQLAAKAWKKNFSEVAIPEGVARPTGCFRNKVYLIKFNADNPTGGFRGKWPICKLR